MNRALPQLLFMMWFVLVFSACSEEMTHPVDAPAHEPAAEPPDEPIQIESSSDLNALLPDEPAPRRVFVSPRVSTTLFLDLDRLEPLLTYTGDVPTEHAPWFRVNVFLSLHTDVQRPYMDLRLRPVEVRFYERSLGECTARLTLRWDDVEAPVEELQRLDTRILRVMANSNEQVKRTVFATVVTAAPQPQQWGDAQACAAFVGQMVGQAVEVNVSAKSDKVVGYMAAHRRFSRTVSGGLRVKPPFLMLPGSTAQLQLTPMGQSGQQLSAGSNWDGYDPFTLIAPASRVETMAFEQHFKLALKAGQKTGAWHIEPPVGETFGGEVISTRDLTSWRTSMCGATSEDWQTCSSLGGSGLQVPYGSMVCAHAEVLYRDRQPLVAGRLPLIVESQTPDVCPVVDMGMDEARPVVCVHSMAAGQCRFSIRAPDAPQLSAQHHQFGVLDL